MFVSSAHSKDLREAQGSGAQGKTKAQAVRLGLSCVSCVFGYVLPSPRFIHPKRTPTVRPNPMAVSATLGTAISKAVRMSATLRGWRLGGVLPIGIIHPIALRAFVAFAVKYRGPEFFTAIFATVL